MSPTIFMAVSLALRRHAMGLTDEETCYHEICEAHVR